MKTLIMKFGGTSVGSLAAIRQAIEIVRAARAEWPRLAVVISAMSGVTDALIAAAHAAAQGDEAAPARTALDLRAKHLAVLHALAPGAKDVELIISTYLDEFAALCHAIGVLGEASPRALDAISSLGERMSAPLVAAALTHAGLPAQAVDAAEVILTDAAHQSASPDMEATEASARAVIEPLLTQGVVPVITGFIGATRAGVVTTLGRGGSDFSAAIFGVALGADEVWIWTDVDGVMTADPRVVADAQTLHELSFREISELAYYGAKVLHPKTIRPVIERGIDLWIKNTFNPGHPGTLIVPDNGGGAGAIKAVTAIKGQGLITIEGRGMLGVPGVAARTFGAVARSGVSVTLITQASSEQSICFSVPSTLVQKVIATLKEEFRLELARRDIDNITAIDDSVIVTVVGAGMKYTPGIAGRIFSALGSAKVNVIAIAQGSSECSISLVVDPKEADEAVRAIHNLIVS